MARYVTPAGVEIEIGDNAARAVGYRTVDTPPRRGRKPKAQRNDDELGRNSAPPRSSSDSDET